MYNGDEKLISDGVYLPYTMLNFWQWSLSNIQFGMTRGTFADFIVRCSLDSGGIITRPDIGTGFEPYDLEGPVIRPSEEYLVLRSNHLHISTLRPANIRRGHLSASLRQEFLSMAITKKTRLSSGTTTSMFSASTPQQTIEETFLTCLGGSFSFCLHTGLKKTRVCASRKPFP